MSATLPVLAGVTSTIMFAFSTVPMLVKAGRTTDMSSYSLGNIVLVNVGNVVHSVYVFHLPVGPIWALHVFYLVSSAVQLTCYLRCLPRTRGGLSNVALRRVRSGRPDTVPRTRFGRRCVVDGSTGQEIASMMRRSRSAAFPRTFRAAWYAGQPHALQGDQGHRGTEHGPPGPRNCSRPGGAAAEGPRARLRFPEPSPRGRIPITATGLSKSFGSLEVFTDVDLAVDRGSRVVVLGLAGAGKTTLPRILAGIEPPDNRHGGAGGTGCSWATKPRSTRPLRHHAERAGERAGGSPGPLGGEGATGAGHGPFLR